MIPTPTLKSDTPVDLEVVSLLDLADVIAAIEAHALTAESEGTPGMSMAWRCAALIPQHMLTELRRDPLAFINEYEEIE